MNKIRREDYIAAQRNLAEAERGFEVISLIRGTITFLAADWYVPFRAPSRNDCLTRRSPPLWRLIMPIRPPGRKQHGAALRSSFKEPISSLTSMRRAWNVRAAGG